MQACLQCTVDTHACYPGQQVDLSRHGLLQGPKKLRQWSSAHQKVPARPAASACAHLFSLCSGSTISCGCARRRIVPVLCCGKTRQHIAAPVPELLQAALLARGAPNTGRTAGRAFAPSPGSTGSCNGLLSLLSRRCWAPCRTRDLPSPFQARALGSAQFFTARQPCSTRHAAAPAYRA